MVVEPALKIFSEYEGGGGGGGGGGMLDLRDIYQDSKCHLVRLHQDP